ncbi:MAG: hypothetical protein PHS41_09035 [Victivallaceae bacterium]|nr:hypothetical protein [Victivallaceae bacterium]
MELGLGDWVVAAAYWGNLAATAVCVCYGARNWHRGGNAKD